MLRGHKGASWSEKLELHVQAFEAAGGEIHHRSMELHLLIGKNGVLLRGKGEYGLRYVYEDCITIVLLVRFGHHSLNIGDGMEGL